MLSYTKRWMLILQVIIINMVLIVVGCEQNLTGAGDYKSFGVSQLVEGKDVKVMGERKIGINYSDNIKGFMDGFQDLQRAKPDSIEINIPWTTIEIGKEEYVDPYDGVLKAIGYMISLRR